MKFFAIDIGGTSVKWGLVGEGKMLEQGSVPTDFKSPEHLIETLVSCAAPYLDQTDGVGVSVPGGVFADDPDGTVHRGGALTYMDGYPLGKVLRERFGVPVAVENDGKCCALGEYAHGALRGSSIGVVLAIGTGIGGGIVINGEVLHGAHCFAGEFSFLNGNVGSSFDWGHSFGDTGSWRGLRDMVLEEKGMGPDPRVTGRQIFAWIEDGDAVARRGLQRYALQFDRWLINLQAVLDPDVFAIAGGISCHDELLDELRAQLPRAAGEYGPMMGDAPLPHIVRAELCNDANLFGAVVACERLLSRS